MNKITLIISFLVLLAGCSVPSLDEVLSDERTDYDKSRTLPPLEVPPDLRANEPNDSMVIPGESTSVSKTDFENRGNPQASPTTTAVQQPGPSAEPFQSTFQTQQGPIVSTTGDGPFVVVRGDRLAVWNRLRSFITGKGYLLELDDQELGYMETDWSDSLVENGVTFRQKFKIFAEQGAGPEIVVLYIDNVRQEQAAGSNGGTMWVDREINSGVERVLAGEMNVFFNGRQVQDRPAQEMMITPSEAIVATNTNTQLRSTAELQDVGNDRVLLAIPEEYTLAWRRTEQALLMLGMQINNKDQERGLYEVIYFGEEEEKGWVNKLKFWVKGEKDGTPYQVALTGVGNRTELVLLNGDGDWDSSAQAEDILAMLLTYYNRLM